ncbi:unnamed protein product, partial [Ectocarpus sp. 12 AP-2014]
SRRGLAALKTWVDSRNDTEVYKTTPVSGGRLSRAFPGLRERVDFQVQCEAVSLHLPLHRFFCKVVQTLAQEGMAIPRVPQDVLLPLVEFPMRALVFHAQVMARLWVRNGLSAQHQVGNYSSPSLCRHMRDLDMVALQVGCLHMGAENFLGLLIDKFALEELLLEPVPEGETTAAASVQPPAPPGRLQQSNGSGGNSSGGAPAVGPQLPLPPFLPLPTGVAEGAAEAAS